MASTASSSGRITTCQEVTLSGALGSKPLSSHEAHPVWQIPHAERVWPLGGGIKGQDGGLLAGQPCGILNEGPGWPWVGLAWVVALSKTMAGGIPVLGS